MAIVAGAWLSFPGLLPNISGDTKQILLWADNSLCIVFSIDFIAKMVSRKGERARYFFKDWGWADLVSSIPTFVVESLVGNEISAHRLVRVLRVIRIIRGIKEFRTLHLIFAEKKISGIFFGLCVLTFALVFVGAMSVLWFEKGGEDSHIKTAADAVWWAVVTITTVGYGDFFPSTFGGRMVAGILMLVGIGLFGSLTAWIATTFVPKSEDTDEKQISTRMDNMESDIRQIRKLLEEQKGHSS